MQEGEAHAPGQHPQPTEQIFLSLICWKRLQAPGAAGQSLLQLGDLLVIELETSHVLAADANKRKSVVLAQIQQAAAESTHYVPASGLAWSRSTLRAGLDDVLHVPQLVWLQEEVVI